MIKLNELYEFIVKRMMGFGGDVPSTEVVQQSILRLLEDHSHVDAAMVVDLLYNNHPRDRMVREVLQAAQILVNQGVIQAQLNQQKIDPVYGSDKTAFHYL